MESIKKLVAENLKNVCKLKKIKNKDIAAHLGVTGSSVSHWLKGDNALDMDNLYWICRYIGVSLDQIFGIDPIYVDTLTSEENNILISYRKAGDETQSAIRKILDIPEAKKDTLSEAE